MEKIERVARALCSADGKDPNGPFQSGEMEVIRSPNMVAMDYKMMSNWTRYEAEARRFIAAFEAAAAHGE